MKNTKAFITALLLSACNPMGKESTVEFKFRPGMPASAYEEAPVAQDMTHSTGINTLLNTHLKATDANNDVLSFSIVSPPSKGTVAIVDAEKGTFTYTPASNTKGVDSFKFKASDGTFDSNVATVSLSIDAVNFTKIWAFDAFTELMYSFNTSLLELIDGSIKLKTVDQLDDDNSATGFAGGTFQGIIFDEHGDGLSEGLKLGFDGSCNGESSNCSAGLSTATRAGVFTSRVMGAGAEVNWSTMSWVPSLPFMKELPDASCEAPCLHNASESNSPAGYTSLVGSDGTTSTNDLMTGLVALWHLNGTVGAVTGGTTIYDSSGRGNHGTAVNTDNAGMSYAPGSLRTGITFASGLEGVQFGNPGDLAFGNESFTISTWFKSTSTGHHLRMLSKGHYSWTRGFVVGMGLGGGPGTFSGGLGGAGQNRSIFIRTIEAGFNDGKWHHGVMVVDRINNRVRLYVDGVAKPLTVFAGTCGTAEDDYLNISACPDLNATSTTGLSFNGHGGSFAERFPGTLDEIAMWNRALHPQEIVQLYQRAASRIKFQVRTCSSVANCEDETWKGLDGTAATYFSEINNNTSALNGNGDVKATLPSIFFPSFTNPPDDNGYFQYRAIFEADHSNAAWGPELKSLNVGPIHYPPVATISSVEGVDFYSIENFSQALGSGGCPSGTSFTLSTDNVDWKYWNGAAWSDSDGSVEQSNSAPTIQAHANSFGNEVSRGNIYFKAFLRSSGTTHCELNNLSLSGEK